MLALWFIIISCICCIISTAFAESSLSVFAVSSISLLDSFDCSESFLIWSATTPNPLPLSPALAASIEAFRLRRFVSSAIDVINAVASWIFCTESLVRFVCSCTSPIMRSTSTLMFRRLLSVSAAFSLDCCMEAALSSNSSTSADVSVIFSPIMRICSDVFWEFCACSVEFSTIWLTAMRT